MATTKLSHRILFLTIAVTFLLTAVGVTGLAVWQDYKSKQAEKAEQLPDNLAACKTTSPQSINKKGTMLQGTKLANFTPCKVETLQTIDVKVGEGTEVKPGDTVTVDYTGAVAATGVIFQSSLDAGQTATFGLSQVIPGWTQGIPGMKEGGVRRLLIPAPLAYGSTPPPGSGIPADADLVFDVTLHKIGQ